MEYLRSRFPMDVVSLAQINSYKNFFKSHNDTVFFKQLADYSMRSANFMIQTGASQTLLNEEC